jgi:hypothetical protein
MHPDRARLVGRLALAAALLAPLALYRDAVLRGQVFYDRDINSAWVSHVVAFGRAVRGGAWPVWDPWLSFGEPMWAYPTQVPYPWFWLNLLMAPWTYYTVSVIAHALLGVLGMRALGRHLGVSATGSATMGAAWALCGPVVSTTNMLNLYTGTGWLPWMLLGLDRGLREGRSRDAALCGVALAAPVLAGSEVGLLGGLLLATWVAAHLDWRHPLSAGNRRAVLFGAAAAAGAVLLSAAQWLPTLELLARTSRSALAPELRTMWSVHPLALAQLALPVFTRELPLRAGGPLFDELQGPFLPSIHLGIPLLALAAASAFSPRRGLVRLLATLAAVTVIVGLGRYTPLSALIGMLPVLKGIRFPMKALILTAFCACVLAGLGFDAWERARDRRWARMVVAPVLALNGLAALALLTVTVLADRWAPLVLVQTAHVSYAQALAPNVSRLLIALVLGLATAWLAARRPRAGPLAMAGCAVAVLLAAHDDTVPTTVSALYRGYPPLHDNLRPGARLYSRPPRPGWEGPTLDPFFTTGRPPDGMDPGLAVAVAQREALWPQMTPELGLSGSCEPDLKNVQPQFLLELCAVLDAADPSPLALRLLQLTAVDAVVTLDSRGLPGLLTPLASRGNVFGDPVHLWAVPDPLPRVYVVGSSRTADGRQAIATLARGDFDPRREVVLPAGAPRAGPTGFQGQARVAELRADRAAIDVEATDAGWLVMVETFDPNWVATVDGAPAPLLRANVAFRAVPVPAGRHHVSLAYRPRSVVWGACLSGVGLLWLAALCRPQPPASEQPAQGEDLTEV